MLCSKCGQREATTHYQQTINGKTIVMNVCPECAKELGLSQMFHGFSGLNFNIADVFAGLLESLSSSLLPTQESAVYPECHSDLKTIINSGKIGCARCYTTFRNELIPTIEQLHGKVYHQGKLPRSAGEAARQKAHLSSLKKKLEEAIRTQDFENAAKYRDEIRELEKGDENHD